MGGDQRGWEPELGGCVWGPGPWSRGWSGKGLGGENGGAQRARAKGAPAAARGAARRCPGPGGGRGGIGMSRG